MSETRDSFIQGLRDLATFLEDHPGVMTPSWLQINVFPNKDELAKQARQTSWLKHYNDTWFALRRTFGPIEYDLSIERQQVCRKVVIGTRIVPAQPAQPEREEETFEWVCEEGVLA